MNIWNNILDFIFPSRCLGCRKIGVELCLSCLSEVEEAERETEPWIFPLFDYRHNTIKKAISLLKYKGKKRLARIFAEAMYIRMLEELADSSVMQNFTSPILIPIPLAKKRRRKRGFNQSFLIAKYILDIDHKNKQSNFSLAKSVLIKPKDTVHQAEIKNREKRLKNLRGSFEAKNSHHITGRNIILIDDVTTTGATLKEAKKVLREAGAKKIIAFTIAH